MFTNNDLTIEAAKKFDTEDSLRSFRSKFNFQKMMRVKSFYISQPQPWSYAKANSRISRS